MPGDYLVDGPHQLMTLSVPYRSLRMLAPDAGLPWDGSFGRLHAAAFSDPIIVSLMGRMWAEAETGGPHSGLFVDGAVLAIAAALASRAGVAMPLQRGGLPPHRLRRALEYMEEHLDVSIGLAEIAAEVGLSPHHFCTAFRVSTGLPPHRYLVKLRVERAKELLSTGLAIAQVANACGFASQQHLTTAFKQALGITPGRWRGAI